MDRVTGRKTSSTPRQRKTACVRTNRKKSEMIIHGLVVLAVDIPNVRNIRN